MLARFGWVLLGMLWVVSSGVPVWAADPPLLPRLRDEAHLQADLERLKANPKDADLLREAGTSLNILGAPENWERIALARQYLEQANTLRPNDPFTLIFLGSTLGLQARNPAVGTMEKLSLGNRCFELMDKAVAMRPNEVRFRLVRGTSGLGAPALAGRGAFLDEDVAFLRQLMEPSPPKELPAHMKAAAYLLLGTYAEKKGDIKVAKPYWSKAIVQGKGTRYEDQARAKLAAHP